MANSPLQCVVDVYLSPGLSPGVVTPGPSVLENGPQSQSSVQAGAGANVDTPVDSIDSL